MSFFEDEEEDFFEAEDVAPPARRRRRTGGRPPRKRPPRRRPPRGRAPRRRALVLLAVVVVLILIVVFSVRSCLDSRKESAYSDYFNAVSAVVKDSDAVGQQLSAIFQNPTPDVRPQLEGKLNDMHTTSQQILQRAQAITPPDEFKQFNDWFVAAMQVRVRGLEGLQPAMLNALGAQDENAGAAQISHEMLILLTSDVAYDEFFYQPCVRELGTEQINDVKVPQSKFLADPELATQQTDVTVLQKLKGGPSAQVTGLHGVALSSVKVQPSGMQLSPDQQNNIKAADSLTFTVEVENQGEATETNVPVSITLTTPSNPNPQKVNGTIPSIAPNEHKTVDISGLAAQASSDVAILNVMCGPVPGEKNLSNNSAQYKVVFS